MKVICINETPRCTDISAHLTKGKIYDVTLVDPNPHARRFLSPYTSYGLVNDMGRLIFVACDGFKPLDEFRNDKIEQII